MNLDATTLKGTLTALITPFTPDASAVDYDSLSNLIDFQLAAKVDGFVVCGSTGEAATLSDQEYSQVISFVREKSKGKCICIAGIGTNSTQRAVLQAKHLEELAVDGILLVAPPYNKPSQDGILAHFDAVKSATKLPLVAYNIPGRSVVNILPATLSKMCEKKLIIGVKDSTASLDQILDLISLVGEKLSIVSGEDSLVHALMASSGKGVISASANIVPADFVSITSNALQAKWDLALKAQLKVLPMVRAMFLETNPVPVKAALALKGVIKSGVPRLPLLSAREETVQKIEHLLRQGRN